MLGINGKALKRAAQAIVVQQLRRSSEQLVHRRARGPARDVIQRGGRAQAAGHQRADRLPDRQRRARRARKGTIDRVSDIQLAQEPPRQQQRADLPAGARQRRVQTRKGAGERLQLTRGLQRLLTTKVCHNTMAHPATLVAIALHHLEVRIRASTTPHNGLLDEHVATTIAAQSDRTADSIRPLLPQQPGAIPATNAPQPPSHQQNQSRYPLSTAENGASGSARLPPGASGQAPAWAACLRLPRRRAPARARSAVVRWPVRVGATARGLRRATSPFAPARSRARRR